MEFLLCVVASSFFREGKFLWNKSVLLFLGASGFHPSRKRREKEELKQEEEELLYWFPIITWLLAALQQHLRLITLLNSSSLLLLLSTSSFHSHVMCECACAHTTCVFPYQRGGGRKNNTFASQEAITFKFFLLPAFAKAAGERFSSLSYLGCI